jgi:RPA family protein
MEGAARVFAGDFSGSTLSVQADDGHSAAFVVTPCGIWCRLMFLSGVMTEITEAGDMLRCRLADPTGAFNLVIGGRNSPLAEQFRKIPVPSFVTVTGRAQLYRRNETVELSIRPDHVVVVDRAVRDQWTLATAEATLRRLKQIHFARQDRCTDEHILTAYRHYAHTEVQLQALAEMISSAVQSIKPTEPSSPNTPIQFVVEQCRESLVRELVMEIMKITSSPRGISIDEIIRQAGEQGIVKTEVLSAIESLIVEDECYQPQKGFVKPL